jgi:hypothetical protein
MADTLKGFGTRDHKLIASVRSGLQEIADPRQDILLEQYDAIIRIFEGLRTRMTTCLDGKVPKEISLEIDLTQQEPEVRFHITEKPAHQRFRLLRRIPGKSSGKILVLTKSGYRNATPENLNEQRFRDHRKVQLREASYSPSSFSNIKSFLDEIHRLLIAAQNS